MPKPYNVASALTTMAAEAPYRPGIIFPAGRDAKGRAKFVQRSFQQLNEEVDRYAHGLSELGIRQGDRVLMMVRPGVELIAVVFALLKTGAVPVLIDPGMGRRAFLQCVTETQPVAMIGITAAHALRALYPQPFRSVAHNVIVDGPDMLGDTTLEALRAERTDPFPIAPTTTEDEAAVAFTSGSTGIPKGVVYRHGMFEAQIALLRDEIAIEPGEVDLALLYIFALFNPALGVTTVIPDMDPTKSAEINPAYVVESIRTHGVTNAFGSPTIWKRVAPYCIAHEIRLPSLKRVIMAGAPVPPGLIQTMREHVLAPGADVITPFGATEAMPLTFMSGREIVAETAALSDAGAGMCVGKPLPGITVRSIHITDEPIPAWDDALVVPQGQVGEIAVKGPVVTRTYLNRPEKTAAAKIQDADGNVWHRMGDLGYFDERGRLWFCGRKAHRVETAKGLLFPVQLEAIFNQHPDVFRSAVVGVGPHGVQRPVLIVEPHARRRTMSLLEQQRLAVSLLALGAERELTRGVNDVLIYPKTFPTDVRHNAKIQREKLAAWVQDQIKHPPDPAPVEALDDTVAEPASEPDPASRKRGVGQALIGVGLSLTLPIRLFRARQRERAAHREIKLGGDS